MDYEAELKKAKEELKKLKTLIDALADATTTRATIDAGKMRQGGISRGQYGFIHGRFTQCNAVLSALGRETVNDPTKAKGDAISLFSGLFGGLR